MNAVGAVEVGPGSARPAAGGAALGRLAPPSSNSGGMMADKGTQQTGAGSPHRHQHQPHPHPLPHPHPHLSIYDRGPGQPMFGAVLAPPHHSGLDSLSMPSAYGAAPAWAATAVAAAPAPMGASGLPMSMQRAVLAASSGLGGGDMPPMRGPGASSAMHPLPGLPMLHPQAARVGGPAVATGPGGNGVPQTIGLLPAVPLELQSRPQEAQEGPKPKRAARTNLAAYTAEQKQERRKERARVYSAIARERQEQHMKELKLRVESLTVYKLMIDESPDIVMVLSPDREARILFANEACGRMIQLEPQELLSKPMWELLHPEDKDAFLACFSETILSREITGKVHCRLKCSSASSAAAPFAPSVSAPAPASAASFVEVNISMRKGTQGVISIIRPVVHDGSSAVAAAAAAQAQAEEKGGAAGGSK